jgi:hypothetical protein
MFYRRHFACPEYAGLFTWWNSYIGAAPKLPPHSIKDSNQKQSFVFHHDLFVAETLKFFDSHIFIISYSVLETSKIFIYFRALFWL